MNRPRTPTDSPSAARAEGRADLPAPLPASLPASLPANFPAYGSAGSATTLLDRLARIRVVLVSTSHPGNVGAAARALKTMGLTQLALVTPRHADVTSQAEALAFASGAGDVLAGASVHATLRDALAGCTWAVALTARTREFAPVEFAARDAARQALARLAAPDAAVALVFGSERYGLSNDDVLACQACCTIATDAGYGSLNLAQAVQILAYECRQAALAPPATGGTRDEHDKPGARAAPDGIEPAGGHQRLPAGTTNGPSLPASDHEPPATVAEREQMFEHLQAALIDIGFLDPAQPKKLMERVRRMLSHAPLSRPEINILRGICRNILARRGARRAASSDPHDPAGPSAHPPLPPPPPSAR